MGNSQELPVRNATPAESGLRPNGSVSLHASRTSDTKNDQARSAARRQGSSRWSNPALMEIPHMSDFQIADHGTIISIRPLNPAARQWLDENVVSEPWQWVQGALCVETRFARVLVVELEEGGFEITR
jgi:hypothetical protein